MPEVATNTPEATLASWPVLAGQQFSRGDTLVVVETAKAAVDVEAEDDGVIIKTLVAEGAEVAVGEPIALLAAPGEIVPDVDDALARLDLQPPARIVPAPGTTTAAGPPAGPPLRLFASPLARKLARAAALPLDEIEGTGPSGRVVRRDVENAIEAARTRRPHAVAPPSPQPPSLAPPSLAPSSQAPPSQAPSSRPDPLSSGHRAFRDEPHSKLRRTIASRLAESKQSAPHFYLRGAARVDRLLALRAELNEGPAANVSVNDLVVKAVAAAHRRTPAMNVEWRPDAIRTFDFVDVAIAVATPNGLVTPVLRDVDRISISALAAAARDLVGRAREGRLQQHEIEGGSTTVTNLGMFGTAEFAAIINPPQAAILAVGAAAPEPVVTSRGKVRAAKVLHVTLSVDHRPVDGATAAQWMQGFLDLVEHPLQLLA
jgi:pyruvate dehydrogenase E2 component (dihydrolipoamide acetyltransferase)